MPDYSTACDLIQRLYFAQTSMKQKQRKNSLFTVDLHRIMYPEAKQRVSVKAKKGGLQCSVYRSDQEASTIDVAIQRDDSTWLHHKNVIRTDTGVETYDFRDRVYEHDFRAEVKRDAEIRSINGYLFLSVEDYQDGKFRWVPIIMLCNDIPVTRCTISLKPKGTPLPFDRVDLARLNLLGPSPSEAFAEVFLTSMGFDPPEILTVADDCEILLPENILEESDFHPELSVSDFFDGDEFDDIGGFQSYDSDEDLDDCDDGESLMSMSTYAKRPKVKLMNSIITSSTFRQEKSLFKLELPILISDSDTGQWITNFEGEKNKTALSKVLDEVDKLDEVETMWVKSFIRQSMLENPRIRELVSFISESADE
jgi:hypothetical protein